MSEEQATADAVVQPGLRTTDGWGREFRVMAVSEGYALCRCDGAFPFVASVRSIERVVERLAQFEADR